MNVSSVQSTTGVAATGTASKAKNSQSAENAASATDRYSSTISEIASKYDPRHIALDKIPSLAKDLYSNGLISNVEAVVMSSLPTIMKSLKGGETIGLNMGADGAVDLLKYEKIQLETAKSFGDSQQLEERQKTIDTLESLTSHRQRGASVNMTGAIAAYEDGISISTVNTQRIIDVLESLVANRGEKTIPA